MGSILPNAEAKQLKACRLPLRRIPGVAHVNEQAGWRLFGKVFGTQGNELRMMNEQNNAIRIPNSFLERINAGNAGQSLQPERLKGLDNGSFFLE